MSSPFFLRRFSFIPLLGRRRFVTDGLILHLNASDALSYTGANGVITNNQAWEDLTNGALTDFTVKNNAGTATAYIEGSPKYLSFSYYDVGYANTLNQYGYNYGDYIQIQNNGTGSALNMNVAAGTSYNTSSRTIEYWGRITAPPQDTSTTDSSGPQGSGLFGGGFGIDGILRLFDNQDDTCDIAWTWDDSSTAEGYRADIPVSLNTWSQIVVVLQPSDSGAAATDYKCTYYINGVNAGTITSTDTTGVGVNSNQNWWIGRSHRANHNDSSLGLRFGGFVNHDISIFRQYNRALTDAEVLQNYRAHRKYFNAGDINPPQPPVSDGYQFPSSFSTATVSASALTIVPTFHCAGLYWNEATGSGNTFNSVFGTNETNEALVRFRPVGTSTWRQGLSLWYDDRDTSWTTIGNQQYRGSIIDLQPNTQYEVQVYASGSGKYATTTFTTWNEEFPVGTTIVPSNSSSEYNVNTSGTSTGYVLYDFTNKTIDGANLISNGIVVHASYAIIRGATIKNVTDWGINIHEDSHHIVIENCDISAYGEEDPNDTGSGWAKPFTGGIGTYRNSQTENPNITNLVIQNNVIHDPLFDSNSWAESRGAYYTSDPYHPRGSQAIDLRNTGGNHVIRYNNIYSTIDKMHNDCIGGGNNLSKTSGNVNKDTDIYGNIISYCWDDALEIEGTNQNIRIWNNLIKKMFVGTALSRTAVGPVYIWRNVYTEGVENSTDTSGGGKFLKIDTSLSSTFGGGRVYVMHNTVGYMTNENGNAVTPYDNDPNSDGVKGQFNITESDDFANLHLRNNILRTRNGISGSTPPSASYSNWAYNLYYNGAMTPQAAIEINGIQDYPVYDGSTLSGPYALSTNSRGYDEAVYIPNFNDTHAFADIGAQERGAPEITFGTRTTITPPPTADFNPPYPRIHAHLLGGGWYTAESVSETRLELLSRYHTAILGLQRRWTNGGYDMSTIPAKIKSYNPDIKLICVSSLVQAENYDVTSGAHYYIKQKIENEVGPNSTLDWWLYDVNDQHIYGWGNRDYLWRINCTETVAADSNGRRFPQWLAHYLYDVSGGTDFITVGKGLSEGAWDGVYEDDQYLTYSHPTMAINNGDWDQDGTAENATDADLKGWMANAHKALRDECKAIAPNNWFFGNMVNLFNEPSIPADFRPNDGGFFEEMCRYEATQGWSGTSSSMMERYRYGMNDLTNQSGPKIGILHNAINIIRGYYNGTNPARPTLNYSNARWNRYFLCSTLMDNGFYTVSDSAQGGYSNLLWFDEFWGGDLQETGYLGYPIDGPQTSATTNGVYIREFDNGLVLVNPGGNGTQTINVGLGWKRINGQQDPVHNNGQPVTSSITLQDRDGIILLRDTTQSAFNPDYPRLHAHCAGIKTVNSAVDTVIARHHTSMHGLDRNFSSGGYNLATFPAYVKSLGNSNLKMFNAQAVVQSYNQLNGSAGYAVAVYNKMFAEKGPNGVGDWWLRTATGANIQGYTNQLWRRNITTLVTPDSQGRNNNQWHFQWLYAKSSDGVDRVTGGYGMSEGAWDGLYEDDQYLSGSFSPTNADYNEDGVADNPLNATVQQWIIDGHWSYRNAMKAAEPNWYFMGNISSYLAEIDSGDYAMPASLVGINDAAIFETINQREFYAGWSAMMQRYRLGLSWLSGPKIGVFLVDLDRTRDLYATPGDAPRIAAFEYSQYQWNRYWLCSCLMDNGFYSVADGAADGQGNAAYSTVWWFDEFWGGDDVQQVGYLGQPIDPPQTSAYSNGVYVREFENGLVILNPGNGGYTAGPGTKTITLPSAGAGYQWKRLSGSQDAAVNTGQVQSSSLTINERDGIILRRVAV